MIFEQGTTCFRFGLGPANDLASPVCMCKHAHTHAHTQLNACGKWWKLNELCILVSSAVCVCVCACVCVLVAHSQRVLLQRAVLYQYQFSGFILYYSYRWRRKWQPTPVVLPGKPHGWRSLVGYSPWSHKESDTTEQLHFHSYRKCCHWGKLDGGTLEH